MSKAGWILGAAGATTLALLLLRNAPASGDNGGGGNGGDGGGTTWAPRFAIGDFILGPGTLATPWRIIAINPMAQTYDLQRWADSELWPGQDGPTIDATWGLY